MSVCVQWFGDLVTPEWWGELWLKEGLASYFEALGATAANPDLAVLDTFYGDETSKALDADARNNSNHPLVNPEGMLLGMSSWHYKLIPLCSI
jgi:aminopeptidase N